MFDKKETGKISEDDLIKILQNKRGEPLDDDEIKAMYKVSCDIVAAYAFITFSTFHYYGNEFELA